jgi:hypothetical protein
MENGAEIIVDGENSFGKMEVYTLVFTEHFRRFLSSSPTKKQKKRFVIIKVK